MSDSRPWSRTPLMVVAACLVIEVVILVWPAQKNEANGWYRRIQTPEIAGSTTLMQQLTVSAPNLSGVTFFAHPAGPSVSGTVDLELAEIRPNDRSIVAHQRIPAQIVVGAPAYTYRFPAVADSRNHTYQLTMSMPDTVPGHGITVDVIRHEYGGGDPPNVLVFNGKERYGSLRFTTDIDDGTMLAGTLLTRIVDYLSSGALGPYTTIAVAVAWVLFHCLAVEAVFAQSHVPR